jgi:hypothetical protein
MTRTCGILVRMRLAAPLLALVVAALFAGSGHARVADVESGFVVFKDLGRGWAVTEVRDSATGRIVARGAALGDKRGGLLACLDPRHRFVGGRWRSLPTFFVNTASLEGIEGSATTVLPASDVLADVIGGGTAWSFPVVTDCPHAPLGARYAVAFGGPTDRSASLGDGLTADGFNVVEFRSLVGTICDGALACTVLDIRRRRIVESDMLFEKDITRLSGLADYWSTGDTTLIEETSAQFAVIDTAVHEFGHFAGLDHVERSPALTMFPAVHDGMQTLGRGDILGLRALY